MDLFGTGASPNNAEQKFYGELFKTFDPQNFGTIAGGQVFGFFLSSGLNKAALGDIWDESTQKQSGGLSVAKFISAMKLISLAQKGIAPKLGSIAQHAPVPMPRMQYPAHLQKPDASRPTPASAEQPATAKPAPPDPFGGLTDTLGFDLGSSAPTNALDGSNGNVNGWGVPPSANPQSVTMGGAVPALNGIGNGNVSDLMGVSPKATEDMSAMSAGTASAFASPPSAISFQTHPMSVSQGPTPSNENEYGPASSYKHSDHNTLTVSAAPTAHAHSTDDGVKPPGLSRRQSTKILYQEERLREQIRQAEQREKLAKKQANTQRIENERLSRENEQLKLEVTQARQAQAEALQQSQTALTSVGPMRAENEKLKQAISEWKELIQTKDQELEALESEVDELRLRNEKLENKLVEDGQRHGDLQFRLDSKAAALQELMSKEQQQREEMGALRQEMIAKEDEKRAMDLAMVRVKDELKKLKRSGNSGLGFSAETVKQKEQDMFGTLDLSAPAPAPVQSSPAAPVSAMGSYDSKEVEMEVEFESKVPAKAQSDDDDSGVVVPGMHDFGHEPKREPESSAVDEAEEEAADSEPDMIDEVVSERVEVSSEVVSRVPFGEEEKGNAWFLALSDIAGYDKYFAQADTNNDGVVDGGEAVKFFSKSKLNRKLLAKIWVLCDQKKQGKLNKIAFCAMFHLVFTLKKSAGALSVPSELPRCLTLDFLEQLGTEVEKKTMQKKQKAKKKKTPPPLPADDNADAFASLGNENWGNDFSFDSPGTEQPAAAAPPKETPGGETEDGADQNWNAFGAFFDQ